MIKFYGIFEINCDFQFDHNCWEQDIVQVDITKGETREQAEKFVIDMGWELGGQAMCPYCSNGIERVNNGLSLVGDDDDD